MGISNENFMDHSLEIPSPELLKITQEKDTLWGGVALTLRVTYNFILTE